MMPATVALTGPVDMPGAMVAVIWVSLQLLATAVAWLNCKTLLLCAAPKPLPVMVTTEPFTPTEGDKAVIAGAPSNVNCTPLLVRPKLVTVTGPLAALEGMNTEMLVS